MTREPGLYVAATPIGNLKDITLRVIEMLGAVDLILCEDTRVTGRLLQAHGIKTPMRAYHDHNAAQMRPEVLEKLQDGAAIAIVSDAGTPLISDPGYKLVRAVRDAGLPVVTLPGPSALTAALSIAGAPTDRFLFAGFLPVKQGARRGALTDLAVIPATLAFYETGPRLARALTDMADVLGERRAAVARELTKIHEEVREGSLADLAAYYAEAGPPKGEIVLIVHPPAEDDAPADLDGIVTSLLADHSVKEAASLAAEQTGLPRKQCYEAALAWRGRRGRPDRTEARRHRFRRGQGARQPYRRDRGGPAVRPAADRARGRPVHHRVYPQGGRAAPSALPVRSRHRLGMDTPSPSKCLAGGRLRRH